MKTTNFTTSTQHLFSFIVFHYSDFLCTLFLVSSCLWFCIYCFITHTLLLLPWENGSFFRKWLPKIWIKNQLEPTKLIHEISIFLIFAILIDFGGFLKTIMVLNPVIKIKYLKDFNYVFVIKKYIEGKF